MRYDSRVHKVVHVTKVLSRSFAAAANFLFDIILFVFLTPWNEKLDTIYGTLSSLAEIMIQN